MIDLITFLSSGVPGGILLLLLLLISANVFFYLLKVSKIWSRRQSRKGQIFSTILLFFIYLTLWFALRPPLPPQRIVVLPTTKNFSKVELNADAFKIPELFQRSAFSNLNQKYLIHRWEWLLETLGKDSASTYENWRSTARNLAAKILIESVMSEQGIQFVVSELGSAAESKLTFNISDFEKFADFLDFFNNRYFAFKSKTNPLKNSNDNFIEAKIHYHLGNYEQVLTMLQNSPAIEDQVLMAAVSMQKGLRIKFDRVKANYVKIENTDFNQAKKILAPIVEKRIDTPEVGFILGRIALRQDEYHNADIYLKKAFFDDPANCRIHFALSFLLPERLQEIGYKNRIEILERALFLDPGYSDAVYELAKDYYETGTGTPSGSGSTLALQTMENFLKIKSDHPKILSLLAGIYLRISRIEEAQTIFYKLLKMFPQDSNSYYNLGIVFYQKKDLQNALDYFLKAIQMDENLDSYLYAAVIYRELGQPEKALFFFRERVKRMTGEDDSYAKEAMQGIRTILEEMGQKTDYE